jgi:hypothetical protein
MMMLSATTDTYADDIYQSVSSQFRDSVQTALEGPLDADHRAIFTTINSVLESSLRAWVRNRATIQDVYDNVDNAIRLVYAYTPA